MVIVMIVDMVMVMVVMVVAVVYLFTQGHLHSLHRVFPWRCASATVVSIRNELCNELHSHVLCHRLPVTVTHTGVGGKGVGPGATGVGTGAVGAGPGALALTFADGTCVGTRGVVGGAGAGAVVGAGVDAGAVVGAGAGAWQRRLHVHCMLALAPGATSAARHSRGVAPGASLAPGAGFRRRAQPMLTCTEMSQNGYGW